MSSSPPVSVPIQLPSRRLSSAPSELIRTPASELPEITLALSVLSLEAVIETPVSFGRGVAPSSAVPIRLPSTSLSAAGSPLSATSWTPESRLPGHEVLVALVRAADQVPVAAEDVDALEVARTPFRRRHPCRRGLPWTVLSPSTCTPASSNAIRLSSTELKDDSSRTPPPPPMPTCRSRRCRGSCLRPAGCSRVDEDLAERVARDHVAVLDGGPPIRLLGRRRCGRRTARSGSRRRPPR